MANKLLDAARPLEMKVDSKILEYVKIAAAMTRILGFEPERTRVGDGWMWHVGKIGYFLEEDDTDHKPVPMVSVIEYGDDAGTPSFAVIGWCAFNNVFWLHDVIHDEREVPELTALVTA